MNLYNSIMPRRGGLALSAAAMACLACIALAGCADMGGIHTTAQLRTPEMLGLASPSAADQAAHISSVDAQWWTQLGDERLDRYVAEALADSPSLRIAQARIAKAGAAVQQAHANQLPQLSGQASATRQHFSANSIYPPPLGGSNQTIALAELDGRWSLDLFGKDRALLEAAVGGVRAAEADREAARVLLASRIVQTYVQLARLQEQELHKRELVINAAERADKVQQQESNRAQKQKDHADKAATMLDAPPAEQTLARTAAKIVFFTGTPNRRKKEKAGRLRERQESEARRPLHPNFM